MRTVVIVLTVLMALSAVAGLAAAHDEGKVEVDSTDYYYCVGGWGTHVHRHVGPVSASVDVCHPPLGDWE